MLERPPAPLIEFHNVHFSHMRQPVLTDINVQLDQRRIGIMGENGCGKSTLARLMNGLLIPDHGHVQIDGIDVSADREHALRSVGLIFQNPDQQIIFPTVEEEIAFGLEQLGQTRANARARARTLLEQYGRADWAERSTQTLSQGQRHLLCLLSIVAMAPKVIVLDEPYAGLDIPTALQLRRTLQALTQTLVLISHDPAILADCAWLVWLADGRVYKQGPSDTLLPEFVHDMTHKGGAHAQFGTGQ